jgi:hypothetical protein
MLVELLSVTVLVLWQKTWDGIVGTANRLEASVSLQAT